MVEVLGMAHTSAEGLLQCCWWPVGSKLVLTRLTAPVPETMNKNGMMSLHLLSDLSPET